MLRKPDPSAQLSNKATLSDSAQGFKPAPWWPQVILSFQVEHVLKGQLCLQQKRLSAPSPTAPVNMTLNKCSTNDSHQISCSFAGKRVLFLLTGPPGCHVSKPIVANRDAQGPLVAAHGKVEKENRDNGTFSLAPLQLSTMITGSGVFLPV